MTILRNPNAGPVPFHKYSTLLQCCRWLLSTRMVISCKLGQPKSPPTIYTEPGSFPRALGFQYHLRRRTYIGGYLPVLELGFSVFLSSLNQVRGPCWRDEKCQDWPLVVHSQNLLCKKGLFYCTMFNEFTLQHSNLTIGLLMVYLYPSSVHDEDDSPIWNSNWVFFVPLLCLIVRGQRPDSRLRFPSPAFHWFSAQGAALEISVDGWNLTGVKNTWCIRGNEAAVELHDFSAVFREKYEKVIQKSNAFRWSWVWSLAAGSR